MSVRSHISMSLDGYIAGPNQGPEHPLGEGGDQLHEWAYATDAWQREHGRDEGRRTADSAVIEDATRGIGAVIMGRRMFGGDGPWDPEWKGWWGDEPPFPGPVFVLTHHERAPLEMANGVTFTFVTDGIESALSQAQDAAGDKDVSIAGGAQAIQQYLAAGLLDELLLHVTPVLLGGGERLLDDVGTPRLEPVEVVGTPAATHMKYRIVR